MISLQTRITGTTLSRFFREWLGNALTFPIINIFFEALLEGTAHYLRRPDPYSLILGSLIQAYWLSRWRDSSYLRILSGNLIGPAVYTFLEFSIEGTDFFASSNHLLYWGFAATIGILQALRFKASNQRVIMTSSLEGIFRSSVLLVMYWLFEAKTATQQPYSLAVFFDDSSHIFVTLAIFLLAISNGIFSASVEWYLRLLQNLSLQLKTYSEWLLGRYFLEELISNPQALAMTRRERTVLFMDIRSFTRWSDATPPEEVAEMLNQYYHVAETALVQKAIKIKFTADEVMAIFPDPLTAIHATRELHKHIHTLLAKYQLGVGIGLHTGLLVEGLLGSEEVKFYDAIGDTVNIAKRIESAAQSSEILLSADLLRLVPQPLSVSEVRHIQVKGKSDPLDVFLLALS